MKTIRQLVKFGRAQAKVIGAHNRMIGTGCTDEEYQAARSASDQAVSLVKYMVMHLENRHFAVILASAAGMPGYINMR